MMKALLSVIMVLMSSWAYSQGFEISALQESYKGDDWRNHKGTSALQKYFRKTNHPYNSKSKRAYWKHSKKIFLP